jgi:hypothetical protein
MDFIHQGRIGTSVGCANLAMNVLVSVQCKKVLGMLNNYLPRRNSTPRNWHVISVSLLLNTFD